MQINVPHYKFGNCRYFAPKEIADWLHENGLDYSSCGQSFWGAGERGESHYIVAKASREDALAFKIYFPDCSVHCIAV